MFLLLFAALRNVAVEVSRYIACTLISQSGIWHCVTGNYALRRTQPFDEIVRIVLEDPGDVSAPAKLLEGWTHLAACVVDAGYGMACYTPILSHQCGAAIGMRATDRPVRCRGRTIATTQRNGHHYRHDGGISLHRQR